MKKFGCLLRYGLNTLLLMGLSSAFSFADPTQILLVPHAEKSDITGHLTTAGYQQAHALAHWILAQPALEPNVIIANSVPGYKAFGSLETCEPIAHDLKIHINNQYLEKEAPQLATDLLNNGAYNDKKVLVCWDSRALIQIALALGAENPPALQNKQQGYLLTFSATGVSTSIISPYQSSQS